MPCTDSYTHHFNLLTSQYSQDENLTRHLLAKNYTVFVFDTECIQEVDNFKIYIDIHANQDECIDTTQQDLLPISTIIPKFIQDIPIHKVLTTSFDSGGTVSLIHKHVLTDIKPFKGTSQIFTTLAGQFQSN